MDSATSPKRIRSIQSKTRQHDKGEAKNGDVNLIRKIAILEGETLRLICYFLKIGDIFQNIPLLSKFHHQFIQHKQQARLIKTCIEYDGFTSAFKSLKIEFNNSKNETDDCKSESE